MELAGWWARFAAYLIDSIILAILVALIVVGLYVVAVIGSPASTVARSASGVTSPFGAAMRLIADLLVIALLLLYFPGQWAASGQTLGQKALGIMVVREDGQLIGIGRGFLRYLVGMVILDSIVFGLPIGWLWAAWDTKKQAWHDKIAGTVVVRV
jgi:uncharacterized RDD family membrane protein YckC